MYPIDLMNDINELNLLGDMKGVSDRFNVLELKGVSDRFKGRFKST